MKHKFIVFWLLLVLFFSVLGKTSVKFERNGFFDKNFKKSVVLGKGAFGTVFRATNKNTNIDYAIKSWIFNDTVTDFSQPLNLGINIKEVESSSKAFGAEISKAFLIDSQDSIEVVHIYDYWTEVITFNEELKRCAFVVLELCSLDLEHYLKKNSLDPMTALTISHSIINSVLEMHKKQIFHGDLHTGNIMIKQLPEHPNQLHYRFVLLNDFGLSSVVNSTKLNPTLSNRIGSDILQLYRIMLNIFSKVKQKNKKGELLKESLNNEILGLEGISFLVGDNKNPPNRSKLFKESSAIIEEYIEKLEKIGNDWNVKHLMIRDSKVREVVNNLEERISKLEKSNEELKRSNEELKRSNEELKRSNERLLKVVENLTKRIQKMEGKDQDLTNEYSFEKTCKEKTIEMKIESFSKQGWYRSENQDNLFIKQNFMNNKYSVFAVFDGHGKDGKKVSSYLVNNIEEILIESIESINQDYHFQNTWENKLIYSIDLSFQKLNSGIKTNNTFKNGGSTGIIVIIDHVNKMGIIGSVGDSIFSLNFKDTNEIEMMISHNSNNPIEIQRIANLNDKGCKFVNKRLELLHRSYEPSRSFGDFVMQPCIIGVPEIRFFNLSEIQSFLLASDGLSRMQIESIMKNQNTKNAEYSSTYNSDDSTVIYVKLN